jgi:TrmH family RNA methyltransferase
VASTIVLYVERLKRMASYWIKHKGVIMITSKSNIKVKRIKKLQKSAKARVEEGLFVVEGSKMVFEAPDDLLTECFVSETFYKKNPNKVRELGCPYEVVSDQVFEALSDTKTPQGILGLVKELKYSVEEILGGEPPLLLVLESIQDPGNLGTIFRTAEAAGVTGIIMNTTCVDIYNPKTIRSTMGAVYRQPFMIVSQLEDFLGMAKESGVKLLAATGMGAKSYEKEDYQSPVGLLIGNEGNGLSESILSLADERIRIPMKGQGESLNVAVAVSVLAYEAYRQRGLNYETNL